MKKYLTVFQLDWQDQLTYRFNFLVVRFRNLLRVLMTYYLWNTIFSSRLLVFGYSKQQMMTYLLLALFIYSFVGASQSNDTVGSEVSEGSFSNYLVKPIGYLRNWFVRDLSFKSQNTLFSLLEIFLLWIIFRPPIYFLLQPQFIILFIFLLFNALLINFLVSKSAIAVVFWAPEYTWGFMFLFIVLGEMLTGLIFPLDLLPHWAFTALQFTPFPYFLYFPTAVILGRYSLIESLRYLTQGVIWIGLSYWFLRKIWKRGLKAYSAYGN